MNGLTSALGISLTMPLHLAQLLGEQRDQIVARWVSELQRKDVSPAGIARPLLTDHMPKFLDNVVAELARKDSMRFSLDAIDASATARRHGGQRWSLGYDMGALIREYSMLRHCILQAAEAAGVELSIQEFDVLAKCLGVGVAEAVAEYAKFRDRQLNAQKGNLEFLAEAGQLLASSLDYRSTLSRLTGLIVPHLADWCAVHLDGQSVEQIPLAHVDPGKLSVLRKIYAQFPFPEGSPYGYSEVAHSGEPHLERATTLESFESVARTPEQLELLRELNVCSWMTVPLRVQGAMSGAFTLACSDSGRHYGDEDLVLAEELARRAAAAIDNARLYELSQIERQRVEAATRAKDEFIAMVSHELRTPLNAILGWLRLMREGSLPESKREHAFSVIERNANAQNQLVAELLDVSRITAGKIRLEPREVDLCNIVDTALEGIRPAVEAKHLRISTELDRSDSSMLGDGDRLQQVVWNLLSNAVKFTPKEGQIAATVHRVGSELELRVRDSGEGIPKDFLPNVFDSFRQSESGTARRHGGLGIGLSIAKHIVELHGGSIEAHSAGRDQGAEFVVRLPLRPLSPAPHELQDAAATKKRISDVSVPSSVEGMRVLVVDDEADARELIGYLLEAKGLEVKLVSSVGEALETLAEFAPHVLISDIGMPEEDGYTLIHSVRALAQDELSRIPAIALTAFARNEDRTRALVAGFNVHLAKPIDPAELVQAVVDLATHFRSAPLNGA
jgi:signal transduction histidine kinase/ActR/RegA family two-component response regulator